MLKLDLILQIIGLMKDESEGKIMVKYIGLTTKTYSYLINHGGEDEKAKCTKRCIIKIKT